MVDVNIQLMGQFLKQAMNRVDLGTFKFAVWVAEIS